MKPPKYRRLGYASYDDYLRSEHWRARKRAFEQTHPRRCFVCNSRDVVPHHVSYRHLGEERDEDIIWLCPYHHRQIHRNGAARAPKKTAHLRLRQQWHAEFGDLPSTVVFDERGNLLQLPPWTMPGPSSDATILLGKKPKGRPKKRKRRRVRAGDRADSGRSARTARRSKVRVGQMGVDAAHGSNPEAIRR